MQTPIILAGRRGAHKVVYVAFDPKHSDIPFRVAFPVLVGNALQWFTQEDTRARTQVLPGEVYEIRIPESAKPMPREIAVFDPTGGLIKAPVREGTALYELTAAVGVYRFKLGSHESGFAVSMADRGESTIAPRDNLRAAMKAAEKTAEGAPVVEREVWFALALVALLGLCVESYLFHQRIVF